MSLHQRWFSLAPCRRTHTHTHTHNFAANRDPVEVTGRSLTVAQVEAVARGGARVTLAASARAAILEARSFLEAKLRGGDVLYGVNTGVGELAGVVLAPDELRRFQRSLIYSHAASVGEPLPRDVVRAAMLGRVNVHAQGRSACRLEITSALCDLLNHDVTPVVPGRGSVGACGDLSLMSAVALVLLGEGEAVFRGSRMAGGQALREAGLSPLDLEARDGLALINGSNFVSGWAALLVQDAEVWLTQAEIAAAMSCEALLASVEPFRPEVHDWRGFTGAQRSAANIRRCLAGGDVAGGRSDARLQDAYSIRATPQIIGAARDQLRWTAEQVAIELNGAADNPLFSAEHDCVFTGANFQATPVSLPLDSLGAALVMVCALSERRLNRLLNPALSRGLPDFLAETPGIHSGLMITQCTADALLAEQRILAAPAFVQSIPACSDQEDFVSMGMTTALKTAKIVELAQVVLAIEVLAATQALASRRLATGAAIAAVRDLIRKSVEPYRDQSPVSSAIEAVRSLLASGAILQAVDAVSNASGSSST